MILPGSYANGFAPRDGEPLYPELWRGCVGAWNPGLGPTGLTLRDWSGFGNHGTLTNMDAGTDWVVSGGRYTLDFDATNDYVTTQYSVDLTADWSWSFWFRQAAYAHLLGQGDGGGVAVKGLYVQSDDVGKIAVVHNGAVRIESAATTLGAWHHVAVTKTGSTATLYVDNVLIGSYASISASATSGFEIGRIMFGGVFYYSGPKMIDDLRIYARSVLPREICRLASRRGIAYEMAPRRRSSSAVQFNRRRRLLIGASS